MKRSIALLSAVVLAATALAGFAAVATSATSKPATVKTHSSAVGKIVADGKSRTVYLFAKDKHGKSTCSGACAQEWPPVLTKGTPKAGAGIKASLLGTTRRADGTTQVTYNKHPLYTFTADQGKPGSTEGNGVDAFGAKWFAVATNGTAKQGTKHGGY
jgi:predicted lipoprotein with Yx(FWY)xxD motif